MVVAVTFATSDHSEMTLVPRRFLCCSLCLICFICGVCLIIMSSLGHEVLKESFCDRSLRRASHGASCVVRHQQLALNADSS